MTGEAARGALPNEFLFEGRDELPDDQLRSALQHCCDRSGPLDLPLRLASRSFAAVLGVQGLFGRVLERFHLAEPCDRPV
jgi:hypothetical protein